jgi:hypothetical protein
MTQATPPFRAHRLSGNPIIRPNMDARMGANVQGPSLIRVPGWVRHPLGRYYLYFADHKGDYIRLAFADALHGPWRIHGTGALQLAESLYPATPITPPPEATPPPHRAGIAPPGTPGIPSLDEDAVTPHIASPDVHVDHAQQRIVMYFHGLSGYRTQQTRVALSADGLAFTTRPALLGPSYFRVFAHRGAHYALVMPGVVYRSADGLSDFVPGPDVFADPLQRHTALLKRDDTLFVFWTRVGDAPERILVSRIDLSGDWTTWRAGAASEVLRPEHDWEGAQLPVEPSFRGAINRPVNQLRDPAIFEEDGRTYLLYAVQGEGGIAIAELTPQG